MLEVSFKCKNVSSHTIGLHHLPTRVILLVEMQSSGYGSLPCGATLLLGLLWVGHVRYAVMRGG